MRVCDLEFDRIRRLTTPPTPMTTSTTSPNPPPSCHTVWKYYCRDNFGWREYSEVRSEVRGQTNRPGQTVPLYFHRRVCFCLFCSDDDCAAVKERTRILLDSVLLSSAACGEAHRGGQFPWSEGGALYYTPEPVYPQHQGGLPAERHLWIQTADPKTAHVPVLGDADASSSVSSTVVLQKRHSL